jgi:membrane-bound lytic murein transglycosylase B
MPKRLLTILLLSSLFPLQACSFATPDSNEPRSVATDPTVLAEPAVPSVPVQLAATELRPDVLAFIDEQVARHGFDHRQLQALFGQVRMREDIIALITRPAERTKPWYEYREIFLDQARIDGGVEFWNQNRAALSRAEQIYGVPPEIVVAIIGVETRYGRITGRHGVLEALTTLAFDYPRRADFFRKELENFLLLTREEGIDPLSLQGSYAGAMGIGQFMPSSYRAYAVDFTGDGRRDLWANPVDAIGSVANYLAEHDWRRDQPVVRSATVQGNGYRTVLFEGRPPNRSVAELASYGVRVPAGVAASLDAALLELEGRQGPLYWLVFNNFYVITRYNRSPLYAMAVYELAQAIRTNYINN